MSKELELDLNTIEETTGRGKFFESTGVKIKLNSKDELKRKFLCDIKFVSTNCENNFNYSGYLNDKLERSSFGQYIYPNKDVYIGKWENDKRDGIGFYLYCNGDMYFGDWKHGNKEGKGVQLWKTSQNGKELDFHAFIGNFTNSFYKQGLYLSNVKHLSKTNNSNKTGEKSKSQNDILEDYVYLGEFNDDGSKSDNKCFLYDSKRKFIFRGNIFNNKAQSGYQLSFINKSAKENEIYDIIQFKIKENTNEVESLTMEPMIDDNEKHKIFGEVDLYVQFLNEGNINYEFITDCYNAILELNKNFELNFDDFKKTAQEIKKKIKMHLKITEGLQKFKNFDEF